jgi:hypothetical protein
MHLERDTIVAILRSGGHHDLALQAACALPRHLDVDKDAALLHRLGANADALLEDLQASSHSRVTT